MTNRHRSLVAYVVIGLLTITNLLYIFSFVQGKKAEFAKSMDQPSIQVLNLLLLVVLVACACIKPKVTNE